MNILILSWRDPKHPNAGGAEQVTHEHAKAWVEAGHNVDWFSASFKGAKKKETISKVFVIRNGRQFLDVQIKAFIWYIFKKHKNYDLVVDQFHGIPFFTPLYIKVKKLAFIHEVAKEVWKLNSWPKPFNLIPAIFGTLGEPLIFLLYRHIPFMTVSDSTKKDLIKWGIPSKNIKVVHNGVKVVRPKPFPKKEAKKTVMFLGAISEDKGINDAFKVFAEIEKKEKGWQYWVVGKASKEYEEKIKTWANELGIETSFQYWGFVDEKTKFELLARAHVLINTSVREGWGLVNIEANSVGTPVVGHNVAGLRDSVRNGKTGLLSKAGNPKLLAENASKLTSSPVIYGKFQKNAIEWSRKFSWKKAGRKSLKLIEDL